MAAFNGFKQRMVSRRMNREAWIALGLFGMMLSLGLSGFRIGPIEVGGLWNRLITLAAALLGGGAAGAAVGTAVSWIAGMGGGTSLSGVAVYGIAGLLGGLVCEPRSPRRRRGILAWASVDHLPNPELHRNCLRIFARDACRWPRWPSYPNDGFRRWSEWYLEAVLSNASLKRGRNISAKKCLNGCARWGTCLLRWDGVLKRRIRLSFRNAMTSWRRSSLSSKVHCAELARRTDVLER